MHSYIIQFQTPIRLWIIHLGIHAFTCITHTPMINTGKSWYELALWAFTDYDVSL